MKNFSKKILVAHSSNDLYGASRILLKILEILIDQGHEIHLFLPTNGPLNKNTIVNKTKLSILNLGIFRKKYFNFFGLINRGFNVLFSTLILIDYIKKKNIDTVYINTSTILSPALASKITGKKCIYHIHEIPDSSKYYTKLLSCLINSLSNKTFVVSKAVKNYWLNNGLNNYKIELIYNGFEFEKKLNSKKYSNKIFITNVSRIIPYKGHLFLIHLAEKIISKRKNIFFEIYGTTLPYYEDYFSKLKKLIIEKKLENNIKFLGFEENTDLMYAKSNFFIHTAVNPDPLPTVIFEAIKNKIPVIATSSGGSPEILDYGKNGLLINPENINQSAERILEYIEDYERQNLHVKRGLSFVKENFNLKLFENKIIKTINKN